MREEWNCITSAMQLIKQEKRRTKESGLAVFGFWELNKEGVAERMCVSWRSLGGGRGVVVGWLWGGGRWVRVGGLRKEADQRRGSEKNPKKTECTNLSVM